jgi:Cu2+-exporting ATPase
LAQIDAIAFDKTGTLTLGRPRLVDGPQVSAEAFAVAAGLAAHSRHPLSRALWSAYTLQPRAFDGVREVPGAGVEAITSDGVWRLGNRPFACGEAKLDIIANPYSVVVLSRDGTEVATFHFEDIARPRAEHAIRQLKVAGFRLGILSGDKAVVVAKLARELGIESWRSGLSPRQKAEVCAEAASQGSKLLMVGDGINDAPALAAAHVSMAPATAADVGRQAADFVFMRDGLEAVPFAIEASRRAGRLIRENFALAIGYNVIAVPIALLGYATPLIAAVAMSTSSIIVVANALRLNRLTIDSPQSNESEGDRRLLSSTTRPGLAA